MKRRARELPHVAILFGALVLAATAAEAVEKSARVVAVGTCWTGYNAVIATMDNGDALTLGNLDDALTKARMSQALVAMSTGELVWYQILASNPVCSATRSTVEWWIVGHSIWP